jgi:S1-C subfamily serine protease
VERDEGEMQSPKGAWPGGTPLEVPATGPVSPPTGPFTSEPLTLENKARHDGGRWLRGWIAVVLIAAVVGAGTAVGVGFAVVAAIHAQDTTTVRFSPNTSVFPRMGDVKSVLARVLPSVVSIEAIGPGCASGSLGGAIELEEATGMILTPSGEILTNNHVVADATAIKVTLYGKDKAYPATLVGTDPGFDVALLQLRGAGVLRAVSIAKSTKTQVGEDVLAIGNSLALSRSTPSVTEGIISAKGRSIKAGGQNCAGTESLKGLLQTQAAINAGNSGGPLVNAAGLVVGMNTAAATTTTGNAPTQNIGFAIPIANIEALLPKLRQGGTNGPLEAFLGVEVESLAPASGQGPRTGAVVVGVFPDSPALSAGIRVGDVIVSFAGRPITSAVSLTVAVRGARPGERVKVLFYRGSKQLDVSLVLGTRPAPEPGAS